jgi:hypothetical protein
MTWQAATPRLFARYGPPLEDAMRRRAFFSLALLSLPGAALAQQPAATPPWRGSGPPRTAAERDERHRWLEENWDTMTPDQRRQVEERFRRGMGPQGMNPEDMRMRWQAMTPRQRQELMYGPGGRMGRMMSPPPAPPPAPSSPGG